MRCIIDDAAGHESDAEIEQDNRQHPGAKGALEAFRQFVTILNAENKQDPDQPKQRARCARGRFVATLNQKAGNQTRMRTLNYGQVTRHYTRDTCGYPKHHELCRAIKLFNPRADYPKAVHVNQDVRQIYVDEDGRDETPILMLVMN